MRRLLTASVFALGLAMTAAPNLATAKAPETFVKIEKPAEGTPILIVMPEVSLGQLTAGGAVDPKEEWSQNARRYLNGSLTRAMAARKYTTVSTDLMAYEDSHDLQMLKLNNAVTDSITMNSYPMFALPTKTSFDWTLGTGAQALVPADAATPPAYVLFLRVQGSYSSGGRAAMWLGMAALGVAMPLGGQVMTASLVDLNTGKVVWYRNQAVASGTDIREAVGADTAVESLLKQLPL